MTSSFLLRRLVDWHNSYHGREQKVGIGVHGVVPNRTPLCSVDLTALWKSDLGYVAAELVLPGLMTRLRFRGEDGDPVGQVALPRICEVPAEGSGREEVSPGRRIAAHHTVDDAPRDGGMVQGKTLIGPDVRRLEDVPLASLPFQHAVEPPNFRHRQKMSHRRLI